MGVIFGEPCFLNGYNVSWASGEEVLYFAQFSGEASGVNGDHAQARPLVCDWVGVVKGQAVTLSGDGCCECGGGTFELFAVLGFVRWLTELRCLGCSRTRRELV